MFTKGKMVEKVGNFRLENASVWSEIRVFGEKQKNMLEKFLEFAKFVRQNSQSTASYAL